MNATSAYDILYSGMPEEDRAKLQKDISEILSESIANPLEALKNGFRKLVDECYGNITVNPWPDWVAQHAGQYDFISALQGQIWKSMLKTNPDKIGEWSMRKLFRAMMEHHPEEIRAICDAELARENADLKERMAFQERCRPSAQGLF
jgi:hypothetical protein